MDVLDENYDQENDLYTATPYKTTKTDGSEKDFKLP